MSPGQRIAFGPAAGAHAVLDSLCAKQPMNQTTLEAMLTEIWTEVLGVPAGPHDNFFALGGNLIRAARRCARRPDIQ